MKTEYHFAGLDHLRALAITLVFFFHYIFFRHPPWIEKFFLFGWCGVDLFFVLSGFLIANQLFAEWRKTNRVSLKKFYLKRVFRIFPPYLLILLIYIFLPAFHERERLPPLWKMFTFTQNFGQNIERYGTFSHAWSLCVEEQFYLLLPLLVVLFFSTRLAKFSRWLIPGIFFLTLLIRWITWQFWLVPMSDSDDYIMLWYRWIYYPTYTRLDGLICGVGLAAAYQFRRPLFDKISKYANPILLAGCVLFLGSYFLCREQHTAFPSIFGFSIIAIGFGLLVLAAIIPGSSLFRFKSFVTQHLATLSYSLYLSHKGLIHITQHLLQGSGIDEAGNLMLLICIIVCISGSLLMRLLIEKPALLIRNRLLRTF